MGKSRGPEHHQFLLWLMEIAVKENVDAIIVAGDIFDTGSPPSYARELYNQFVVNLRATGIHLIVLGGNHDSVATLGESKSLLACLNAKVIPCVQPNNTDQVITIQNNNEPQAIICAIPYLRPRDLVSSQAGQSGDDKQQALQQAIADHYQVIHSLAIEQNKAIEKEYGFTVPIIATGHLTVVGAKTSESVRDLYIGTLDAYPSSAFPPADYIALGHIHRKQKVGGTEHIRYCGSPIPLSFDELNNQKSILLAEFSDAQLDGVTEIDVPRFQPMYSVKGKLEHIESQLQAIAKKHMEELVGEEQKSKGQAAWLDIEVIAQDYLNDLQQRVQDMVKDLPLEVLLLRRARKLKLQSIELQNNASLQELTPKEVFEKRLAMEDWSDESLKAKKLSITRVFDEVMSELDHDSDGIEIV